MSEYTCSTSGCSETLRSAGEWDSAVKAGLTSISSVTRWTIVMTAIRNSPDPWTAYSALKETYALAQKDYECMQHYSKGEEWCAKCKEWTMRKT